MRDTVFRKAPATGHLSTELAVQLDEGGGDGALSAYASVRCALVALYRGDATELVQLARRAQAPGHVPMSVKGLAALREAQGLALAGADAECRRAIDRGAAHPQVAEIQPALDQLVRAPAPAAS